MRDCGFNFSCSFLSYYASHLLSNLIINFKYANFNNNTSFRFVKVAGLKCCCVIKMIGSIFRMLSSDFIRKHSVMWGTQRNERIFHIKVKEDLCVCWSEWHLLSHEMTTFNQCMDPAIYCQYWKWHLRAVRWKSVRSVQQHWLEFMDNCLQLLNRIQIGHAKWKCKLDIMQI